MAWTINADPWKLEINETSCEQWQLTLSADRYSVTFYITDIKETLNAVIVLNGKMKFPAAKLRDVTSSDPCVEMWLGAITAYIKVESNLVRCEYKLEPADVAHIREIFKAASTTI